MESSPNRNVNIHIAIDQIESRRRAKAAGGRWDPKRQVWRLVYEKVRELGVKVKIEVHPVLPGTDLFRLSVTRCHSG